jgi:hypothetical protein
VAGVFFPEPVLGEARVARSAACLDRVQVSEIGGDPAAELRFIAHVAVAGDDHPDAGDAGEQAKAVAVPAERVGRVQVGQGDLNVGQHVPGDQHPAVGEEERTVARRVGVVLVDEGTRPRPVDLVAEKRLDSGEQGEVVAGRAIGDGAEQLGLFAGGDRHRARGGAPWGWAERG